MLWGVHVSGRTHIMSAKGKVEEDIWPMGYQWVSLDPLHPSTERTFLPTFFVSYPDASFPIPVYLQIKLFIRVIIELPLVTRVSQSWSTPAVIVEQNDDHLIIVWESKQMVRSVNYLLPTIWKRQNKWFVFFLFRCSINNGIVPLQYYSNGHIEWDHVFLGHL